MPHSWIAMLLLLGVSASSWTQSAGSTMRQAHKYFKEGDYFQAASLYRQVIGKASNKNKRLHEASIAFFEANYLNEAKKGFELLSERSIHYRQTSAWYLAQIYQHLNKFTEALEHYKLYLKNKRRKNDPRAAFIRNEMKRCVNALRMQRMEPLAIVEPIGGDINTEKDEFACIPSINHAGRFYYSAEREDNTGGRRNAAGLIDKKGIYRADIFSVEQRAGTWSKPIPFSSLINSAMHDQIMDFANNGRVILYRQSLNEKEGKIYSDTFDSQRSKLNPVEFNGPMYPEIGDRALSLFQDSIIIFSSCRHGGYGGYDLYISVFRDQRWSEAVNLGPVINTPFNEDHPFIALDGLTLYFISNNLQSIGGYDIFKTRYRPEANQWTAPINLGIPVNSAGNEQHFRLGVDGLSGTFTSDRKNGNKGKRDIFVAYFKDELEEQLYNSPGSPLSQCAFPTSGENYAPIIEENEIAKNVQYKDYHIEPLHYSGENFLKDPKNQRTAETLVRMMQIHPDIKIKIFGHAYEDAPAPINLYYSIKKSEQLEDYLVAHGIPKNRIGILGVGTSFPMATDPQHGTRHTTVEKWNKRVECFITAPDTSTARISYGSIPVIATYKLKQAGSLQKLQAQLSYSILLGESAQVLNHSLLQREEEITWMYRVPQTGMYKYYIGCYPSFREAEKYLVAFQKSSSTDLRVVAFMRGEEIKRHEIIDYVIEFPDLALFMHYLNQLSNDKPGIFERGN